jgi:N-acetylglucosamine kinase-like BadF-type ATPase
VRGSQDPLTQRICASLGVETASEIIGVLHSPVFDRARIAGLAPVVSAAALEDPVITATILRPAGRALAEMALAVARSLEYESGPLPLALAGGLLLGTFPVAEALIAEIIRAGYDVVVDQVAEPVAGAIVLAKRETRSGRRDV